MTLQYIYDQIFEMVEKLVKDRIIKIFTLVGRNNDKNLILYSSAYKKWCKYNIWYFFRNTRFSD